MTLLTLLRSNSPLASASEQRKLLESDRHHAIPTFAATLKQRGLPELRASSVRILQMNVGKVCNQTCRHCHVDAGPDRREAMSEETVDACLSVLAKSDIETLDITGGAPEMNPHFRRIVSTARKLEKHIIDRCNLTILTAPGFRDLPEFLAEHRVEIVASLPCYLEENCDSQRGDGVFGKSVEAIRRLNQLGYGVPESGLILNLVYNPLGASLPPAQEQLEADYREQLRSRYGIEFNHLFTITNLPISRFLDDLLQSGQYEDYMQTLRDAFNPLAVEEVMCRTMLSVDWQGQLFDCDFNQMLELPLASGLPQSIHEFEMDLLANRPIVVGRHCYGCTAGAGSSCQGALVEGVGS